MNKLKEEEVAKALGARLTWDRTGYSWRTLSGNIIEGTGCFLNEKNKPQMNPPDFSSLKWKDRIRFRIQMLLDILKFDVNTKRLHATTTEGPKNYIEIILPTGKEGWNSQCFTDDQLPEKEQDLLIWLTKKRAEKREADNG